MSPDPPPEDPDRDPQDGSAGGDEDPIEEVDFWEEVGETRPPEAGDLGGDDDASEADPPAGPAGEPDRTAGDGPGDDTEGAPHRRPRDDPLPDAGDRWPGLDVPDDDPDPDPARDREADPASREARPGSELGGDAGPDEAPPGGPDPAEAGDPVPDRTPPPGSRGRDDDAAASDGADEAGRRLDGDAAREPGPPTGSEAAPGGEPGPPAGPGAGPDGDGPGEEAGLGEAEALLGPDEGEETEILRGPDPRGDGARGFDPVERGPVEAGPEPREAVEPADGPCHVCGEDDETAARHTCVSCERSACSSHFWVMFGLCGGCATEDQIRRLRGERTQEDWSRFLGIKWVD